METNYHQDRPEKIIKKHSTPIVTLLGLVVLSLVGLGLWYILFPQSIARLHGRVFSKPLEIYSLTINTTPLPLTIVPGGTLDIQPGQSFSIAGLNTNRWHNYDLGIISSDVDITKIIKGRGPAP